MKLYELSDGDIFIYNDNKYFCFGVIQDNEMLCKNIDTERLCKLPLETKIKLVS